MLYPSACEAFISSGCEQSGRGTEEPGRGSPATVGSFQRHTLTSACGQASQQQSCPSDHGLEEQERRWGTSEDCF